MLKFSQKFVTVSRLRHPAQIISRSMSVRPAAASVDDVASRKKITIQRLQQLRNQGTPITMLTAYDFFTARQCETNDIDVCLVGDSLAQVCLGYDSTTRLTMGEMLHHVKAVSRGSKTPLLVADMPFGSYHSSVGDAIRNAVTMMQEGGAESVKLEGGEEIVPIVKALTTMGIPVMAHIGLMPQRHASLSGYRVQGKDAMAAHRVVRSAEALQDAGAFSIVLEAIPHPVASYITRKIDIPTIGIGAGPGCSGQVLVWDDAMGTWEGHKAKFVRRFSDVGRVSREGVSAYAEGVRSRNFPDAEKEGYGMGDEEFQRFMDMEGRSVSVHDILQRRSVAAAVAH